MSWYSYTAWSLAARTLEEAFAAADGVSPASEVNMYISWLQGTESYSVPGNIRNETVEGKPVLREKPYYRGQAVHIAAMFRGVQKHHDAQWL